MNGLECNVIKGFLDIEKSYQTVQRIIHIFLDLTHEIVLHCLNLSFRHVEQY